MNGAFLSFHLLAADQTFLIHSLESVKKKYTFKINSASLV